jgi:hypothetical protein
MQVLRYNQICSLFSLLPLTLCLATRLLSSIFWEQGFDEVRDYSKILELFEQFDVQF